MIKSQNKNINCYYFIDTLNNLFIIYDKNKKYFNDIILEEDDFTENFKTLINALENTTLDEMLHFFGMNEHDNEF